MLSVFTQFARDMVSERVKAGIAHARSKGKAYGRPKTVALKAEKVQELFQKGWTKAKIARETGMSRTSVRRLLGQNPHSDFQPQQAENLT